MEDRFAGDPVEDEDTAAAKNLAAKNKQEEEEEEEEEEQKDAPDANDDGVAPGDGENEDSDSGDDGAEGSAPEDVDELRKGYWRKDKFTREQQRVKQRERELAEREGELTKRSQMFDNWLATLPTEQREAIKSGKPVPVSPENDPELQELLKSIPEDDVMRKVTPKLYARAKAAETENSNLKAQVESIRKYVDNVGRYLFNADIERQMDYIERKYAASGKPLTADQLEGVRKHIAGNQKIKMRTDLADVVYKQLYASAQVASEKKKEEVKSKIASDMPVKGSRQNVLPKQKSDADVIKEAAATLDKKYGIG